MGRNQNLDQNQNKDVIKDHVDGKYEALDEEVEEAAANATSCLSGSGL